MVTPGTLRERRKARGWSQVRTARYLRVSQPYLSLLESGARPLTPELRRRLKTALRLPPTFLPLPRSVDNWPALDSEELARHLCALGYPAFAYLEPHPRPKNPAALLLWALDAQTLEPRVVEGLPWLLLAFPDLEVPWLVREAKLRDLQNRLGFLAHLAHAVAERTPRFAQRAAPLAALLSALEPSRLAREETLFGEARGRSERDGVRALRTAEAAHWNLLTLWKPEDLTYD